MNWIKRIIITGAVFLLFTPGYAQSEKDAAGDVVALPAQPDEHTPLVFLISGDGGWKNFTPRLAAAFVHEHAPVVALNALRYFWTKKTPDETATTVETLLHKYLQEWQKEKFILVGFSFGADVMPFVVNRLPRALMQKCLGVALFSPGISSDFTIHLSQMLGSRRVWKYNVVEEIRRMKPMKTLFFFGTEEHDFPLNMLGERPEWQVIQLSGGHHYEANDQNLGKLVLEKLQPGR